jgi:hypothetical protein
MVQEKPSMNELQPRAAGRATAGEIATQSRELAEIQTKYLMARKFPRDEAAARAKIAKAFTNLRLAEVASYEYARGGSSISGLSIEAAQSTATLWGNCDFGWAEVARTIGEDGIRLSEIRAYATDLETGTTRSLQFVVRHWRDTRQGGYALTDERDVYELCANMAQRRVRACILAILPRDLRDDVDDQAASTLASNVDRSPEAMAKLLDSFARLGVTRDAIEEKIGRKFTAITNAQIIMLKRIGVSIRDGIAPPSEYFRGADPRTRPTNAAAAAANAAAGVKSRKASTDESPPADEPGSLEPEPEPRPPRRAASKPTPQAEPVDDEASFMRQIERAPTEDDASLILDRARSVLGLTSEGYLRVVDAFAARFAPE